MKIKFTDRHKAFAGLIVLAALISAIFLVCYRPSVPEAWLKIKVGMKRENVYQILGVPTQDVLIDKGLARWIVDRPLGTFKLDLFFYSNNFSEVTGIWISYTNKLTERRDDVAIIPQMNK